MAARNFWLGPLLVTLLLGGCGTLRLQGEVDDRVAMLKPQTEIPEAQLLDLWIELFDPGTLPDDEDDARGLFEDIRAAEARYFPQHLRDIIERTGYWGAVRVVPRGNEGGEAVVRGKILTSDGEQLELEITALDATGRAWFEKRYYSELSAKEVDAALREGYEPFQPLYITVANDLATFRATLDETEVRVIRRTADLQFAAAMAPDPFAAYLRTDNRGRSSVLRLPAHDDPMYQRIKAIRERDYLLLDTLNAHFDNFYRQMDPPYDEWRRSRSAEAEALRAVEREALQQKLIGVAAIIGAIALSATGNTSNNAANSTLRDVMVIGGAYAIKSGFDKDSETVIHSDAIAELGESFSAEAQPLVVEVEGETHKLTGSAEMQYAQWRGLLKRIYAAETGLAPPGTSE
ncbi:MAG: hypothetical protein DRR03_06260 [Gammaproteobacteria bacterium]|nr:MAG: hypothetical protein DRR03_06260 [Gammaproteobacteria bacterium]